MRKSISILLVLGLVLCLLPMGALADTYDISRNDVTINATAEGQTVTGYSVDEGKNVTDKADASPVITGTSNAGSTLFNNDAAHTVTINAAEGATANVTLKDLTINADAGNPTFFNGNDNNDDAALVVTGKGEVNIELEGSSKLTGGDGYAAVNKGTDGELTIGSEDGTGSLTAQGGSGAAGIGGNSGQDASGINVTGGTINASGGSNLLGASGAGIGGGNGGSGEDISVSGGTVNANGGSGAAGIGGGNGGDGSNINVSGGEVNANGGSTWLGGGAGIGGGNNGDGDGVNVSGGNVIANGGNGSAGIGGGSGGDGESINVSGGTVNATGGNNGAGIGGGNGGSADGVSVSGGEVNANGGQHAAGIGGGNGGDGDGINISGGDVNAQGGGSSSFNLGILGSYDNLDGGAGIGGGNGGDGNGVDISGGNVVAEGGNGGAGIGGGSDGNGNGVNISSGNVVAQGGAAGAGIGGGLGGEGNGTTISGNANVAAAGGSTDGSNLLGGLIDISNGTGAAIGSGSSGLGEDGTTDENLDTSDLTTGSVSFYEPGTSAEDILSGDAEAVMYDIIYGSGEITEDEDEFLIFCQQTAKRIQTAASNSTLEIDGRRFPGFMKMVFDALAARPDVALNVRCIIDGKVAEVKIPAGFDFTNALGSKSVLTFSEIAKLVG